MREKLSACFNHLKKELPYMMRMIKRKVTKHTFCWVLGHTNDVGKGLKFVVARTNVEGSLCLRCCDDRIYWERDAGRYLPGYDPNRRCRS